MTLFILSNAVDDTFSRTVEVFSTRSRDSRFKIFRVNSFCIGHTFLFSDQISIHVMFTQLHLFIPSTFYKSFFPDRLDDFGKEMRRKTLGINMGVSFLYCAYSSLPLYFLSFVASSNGMPLTLTSKKLTNIGETREMPARTGVSAGAHRPQIDHHVISSPKSVERITLHNIT